MNAKLLKSLLIVSASILVLLCGCSTAGVYDPIKTAKVHDAVEPVVASIVRRVVQNSPEHADQLGVYFRAVGTVFCTMKTNGNFSPTYLVDQLNTLVVPNNQDIADAKNLIVALYKINYADRFQADLSPEKFPAFLADLLCSSIQLGLTDAGKVLKLSPAPAHTFREQNLRLERHNYEST